MPSLVGTGHIVSSQGISAEWKQNKINELLILSGWCLILVIFGYLFSSFKPNPPRLIQTPPPLKIHTHPKAQLLHPSGEPKITSPHPPWPQQKLITRTLLVSNLPRCCWEKTKPGSGTTQTAFEKTCTVLPNQAGNYTHKHPTSQLTLITDYRWSLTYSGLIYNFSTYDGTEAIHT